MRQTLALLLDSYRDMNARRMFWIVLILSTLVAASFGAVGLTVKGISIFGWEIPTRSFRLGTESPAAFYKLIFVEVGIKVWLTTWATILALISTASIFPDFLASGAIDLYLAKPIGRLRLFLTKYLGGMLFLTLQIFCFCLASFLVIGLRGHTWEPGLFIAVPIVVLFYSYLFCICVMFGVWTRSTIAALLLTMLFWFTIFGIHATELILLQTKFEEVAASNRLDDQIQREKDKLAQLEIPPSPAASMPTTEGDATTEPASRPTTPFWRMFIPAKSPDDKMREQLASDEALRRQYSFRFERAHELFYIIMTVLPKTSETVDLLQRQLVERAGLQGMETDDSPNANNRRMQAREIRYSAQEMVQDELATRSVGWVAGTSIGFECVILIFSAWIFCRRDY
jgi:hypothetical protein